ERAGDARGDPRVAQGTRDLAGLVQRLVGGVEAAAKRIRVGELQQQPTAGIEPGLAELAKGQGVFVGRAGEVVRSEMQVTDCLMLRRTFRLRQVRKRQSGGDCSLHVSNPRVTYPAGTPRRFVPGRRSR